MVEHELLATEPNISDDTPYFFQRIGELAFEAQHAGAEAPKTARRRQRECIATAAHHGVVAAAGDDGTKLIFERCSLSSTALPVMCRPT